MADDCALTTEPNGSADFGGGPTRDDVKLTFAATTARKIADFCPADDCASVTRADRCRRVVFHIAIDDEDVGVDITIDPIKSPYSSGSFAAHDVPKITDRNPPRCSPRE